MIRWAVLFVPFLQNPPVLAAILLPAVWARSLGWGLVCLALLFYQRGDHVSVPVFFGLTGLLWLYGRIRWVALPFMAACLTHGGKLLDQISLRVETWEMLLRSSLSHPILGHGFTTLSLPVEMSRAGLGLHSAHSDWLSLAFHGGWLSAGLALFCLWSACWPVSSDSHTRGIQASLLTFAGMALVRNTIDQVAVVPLLLLLLTLLIKRRS